MSKVLFLNIPSHGHINPTLGLVEGLVKQGDEVLYFTTEEFRKKVESMGATFISYGSKSDFFVAKNKKPGKSILDDLLNRIDEVLNRADIIEYILKQIQGMKFDYIIYGSMFPYGNVISQILNIPAISSFAVFAKPKVFMEKGNEEFIKNHKATDTYQKLYMKLETLYGVQMPPMLDLFFNKGELNIAYTSELFVSNIKEEYDDSFLFIGPPVYDRKEKIEFPFKKINGRKVIYISLGTVFNSIDTKLYETFFKAFSDYDGIVVMSAFKMDISKFHIPENFIVQNYVPQSEMLKYVEGAITHGGMNSTSDLIYNNVPFVTIPIGADQRYIASRVSELGATICLNKDNISPQLLSDSMKRVITERKYKEAVEKISISFKDAGGYKKALMEIRKFKILHSIE
ncbi:macrolide family glycosyltransferase [Ruminococcus sp. AM26-12LB]|uniref:macrolide family glycosyltransferase n=1 Tax=Ruminococcus sp. AM26-12LB TaxID=2293190 RepID=UPI000E4FC27C|nr:macrolide family glycosyltransferase [Ruminococcus sp. AM26-12LB]RHU13771.1 glycosyl transferase [Ruminococcus sp. AM26-12LB]